jgi:hypothetical protein
MDVEAKELQRHGGDAIWFCEIINFSHERDGERSLVHISETETEREIRGIQVGFVFSYSYLLFSWQQNLTSIKFAIRKRYKLLNEVAASTP